MRWTSLAATLMVALGAVECLAETPDFSQDRPQALSLMRGRLLGGSNWWSRYGEPVNATALEQASPSDQAQMGPMPMYGDGYVYGPGACDCPPPCIGHLWAGYFQNPKRCHTHHLLGRHCGCGGAGDCNACGNACGCGHSCFLSRIFGKDGCDSCSKSVSCGCATPVTCTTAASDCGCKPVCGKCRSCHFGSKFLAHWNCGCNSCSSPIGCGCTTPVAPMPSAEKQALQGPPTPLPEEATLFSLPRLN
jgi:hypothetical protein